MLKLLKEQKITIFGEGITAKAVNQKLQEFSEFKIVKPEDQPCFGVISPGLNPKRYIHYNYPLISEIELAFLLFKYIGKLPQIIAVTGTNGKTTTTSLIAHLLDIPSGGNIGECFINFVHKKKSKIAKSLVLELSSYQIEMSPTFIPDIFVLLNITEDHLERHGSMQEYSKIKCSLINRLSKDQYYIYNGNDTNAAIHLSSCTNLAAQQINFQKSNFSKELVQSQLIGNHNKENLLAALTVAKIVKPRQNFAKKVKLFKNIAHRLEVVGRFKGIIFINDSKATNPLSTIAAIKSFNVDSKIILMLGGQKKFAPYDELFSLISERQIPVVSFGQDRYFFTNGLKNMTPIVGEAKSLQEAVHIACKKGSDNTTVLFSPAGSSFDAYKNFEERGNDFREIISKISTNQ